MSDRKSPTVALLEPEVRELVERGDYRDLRQVLRELPAPDIAELLTELDPEQSAIAYRVLPREVAGDVFADLDVDHQEHLIEELGAERARRVVEQMDPDDRVRLLDELPVEVATRLIASLTPETRRQTQAILGYAEDTVGRIMTPDYISVRPEWTVARAIEHIRANGRDAEVLTYIYVTDEQGRLLDDIHIRSLLLADPSDAVRMIMDDRFIAIAATEDQEEAVRLMARYDRIALPVLDSRGLLVGIVTFDDVADVAEEEATEDIHKLGGIEALDQPYMQTRRLAMLKKRGPWLAVLFLGQSITVFILSGFEDKLEQAVVLTLFIPLIIACGGNSGTQTASLMIRALALREIGPADWFRIVGRELVTGLALGLGLGLLGLACMAAWYTMGLVDTDHGFRVAMAITTAILAVVAWGTVLGSTLPLVLQRVGLDPATSSSPLVATLMDATGMLIYFSIAIAFLTGALF